MATITCPHCQRPFERGPEHCPHCHLRLPGAPPVRRVVRHAPAAGRERPARAIRPARPGKTPAPVATSPCPACGHPVTRADEWCRWCHWPVNRRT